MTESPTPPVRWALAGYGFGGRVFHAPLIRSAAGLELVAVVTGSQDRQAQLRDDQPSAVTVAALSDLPALGVAGVTITTPSATHAPLAGEALDLGLHVVVDKPFALDAAAAADLVAHAGRAGRLVVPYQNRRWDSDLLTIRRLLDGDALGRVHRFVSRIDRFRPVKSSWHGATAAQGGGVLLDLGPHLVDQATHLFGPVESVHADLQTIRAGAGAEDEFELHLVHAGGVHSTVAAGLASAAPGPRFQVNGDRAGFVIDGFDIQEDQLKAGHTPADLGTGWGVEPESAWGRLYSGDVAAPVPSERGAWDTFYPAVARAVRGLGAPPVAAHDAVATARVLDAARESARTGTVVRIGPR
ncbi:MAG TPA: Gfo/Idh/MocA family oxidoreductase [Nakamurella sp.]